MKTSRFSDSQIIAILKQAEAGSPVPELCREHGFSSATFYKWRAKFGGMDASLMARLRELEEENRRLKKMYADAHLGVWWAGEPVLVQALVTEASVKRFDIGILIGLTWFNQEQLYTSRMSPGQHGPTTEFLAVIRADGFGQTA